MTKYRNYSLVIDRRPYQRSIGVIVRVNGAIKVTASRTVSERKILKFLEHNKDWIEKVQGEYKILREKFPDKKFVEGEVFPFRGQNLRLQLACHELKKIKWQIAGDKLVAYLPDREISDAEFKLSLQSFYNKQAKGLLSARILHWAKQMQLVPKRISFRSQKTRWGSCSSQKLITLNWRLVAAPVEVADYVIIHELAHLKHQDHSKNFWSLVAKHCPDYKLHKKWLNKNQYSLDFLAKKSELHEF